MLKLSCSVQNYEWGKVGAESVVFQLVQDGKSPSWNPNVNYAELWMGSHPNGPSFLADDQEISLEQYISLNPDCLGCSTRTKFGRNLPFLLKVLSIRKALSIQAHPSKEHAQQLNTKRPDLYKDSNHKPELAVALTPFEALIGFRPPVEIADFVQGIPELSDIIGNDSLSDLIAVSVEQEDNAGLAIKAAYQKLMRADEERVFCAVSQLRDRLILQNDQLHVNLRQESIMNLESLTAVFIRLATDYPGDVGCFSLFFLNYIQLEPGQAVFLEANLPHAYLYGDCVECMACSDNVVRAGLTPKFKDVDCLLSMLLYEPRTMNELRFPGEERLVEYFGNFEDSQHPPDSQPLPKIVSFRPPVEDFAVDRIIIPPSYRPFELLPVPSASILLFISGSGTLQRLPAQVPSCNQLSHSDAQIERESEILKPAARVHETLEFERGSVVFVAAGISVCVLQLNPRESCVSPLPTCLIFRAYVNVDPEPD